MKEHGIIMTAESVRGILEGRKSQTRRVVKPQPDEAPGMNCARVRFKRRDGSVYLDVAHGDPLGACGCPYGEVGDRLWVRETWADAREASGAAFERGTFWPQYRATSDNALVTRWRSPIHMPRWASRITLEITGIRVERLQEITEADQFAEGFEHGEPTTEMDIELLRGTEVHGLAKAFGVGSRPTAKFLFLCAWDDLNEKRGYGWATNPWVWVIEFRTVA